MSGAEDFVAALKTAIDRPSGLTVAVGRVRVTGATASSAAVAEVRGVTAEPIRVTSESWGSPFVASVAAGSVDDRLVLVVFNAGQAIIAFTLGV